MWIMSKKDRIYVDILWKSLNPRKAIKMPIRKTLKKKARKMARNRVIM